MLIADDIFTANLPRIAGRRGTRINTEWQGSFCHIKRKRYRQQSEKEIIFWLSPSTVLFVHFVAKKILA
jgi:hypothetical protein